MTPTDEQQSIIDAFTSGDGLAVEAGAGTGKTSTLVLAARSTQRPGTYCAFNRAIVQDAAARMPMNVQAFTAHALAMRAVGNRYRHRLGGERTKSWQVAKYLGLSSLLVVTPFGRKVLQPSWLAGQCMKAIRNFCASADPAPGPHHVPYVRGIDPIGPGGVRGMVNNDLLRDVLAPVLDKAWADVCDPAGQLRFEHDHYLKMWQLSGPVIPGDFVLFDEAQDASPVMLAAVQAQTDRGAQVVYVGDSQQQIYAWRGAVNALAQVPADRRLFLTQSFRFGPPIAEVANLILDELGASLRIVGHPPQQSIVGTVSTPRAILCRSNAQAVRAVLSLQKQGRAVHLVGGSTELVSFARAAADLQRGERTTHPELACFDSWDEVRAYVAEDALGDDLALLVKLLDEFGIQIVLDALDGMIGEDGAEVIVSTAHKAKGREWDSVRLAADFTDPDEGDPDSRAEEYRLLYVAATRAREQLDVRFCEPIRELQRRAARVPA